MHTAGSSSAIDAPREYFTVETYTWPTSSPPSRKRFDMDERRRRHSECQKRFLARKQRLIQELPQEVARLELQLQLVKAIRSAKMLQEEHDRIVLQLARECEQWTEKPLALEQADELCVAFDTELFSVEELIADFNLP